MAYRNSYGTFTYLSGALLFIIALSLNTLVSCMISDFYKLTTPILGLDIDTCTCTYMVHPTFTGSILSGGFGEMLTPTAAVLTVRGNCQ